MTKKKCRHCKKEWVAATSPTTGCCDGERADAWNLLATDRELWRKEATAAMDLVSRIRFALGDNGLRMQDELIEWCKTLGPRWTPTTTPPEPGHYLTFGSDEGIHTMAYTHKTWFCHGHRETPTHWMPLPDPPENEP